MANLFSNPKFEQFSFRNDENIHEVYIDSPTITIEAKSTSIFYDRHKESKVRIAELTRNATHVRMEIYQTNRPANPRGSSSDYNARSRHGHTQVLREHPRGTL